MHIELLHIGLGMLLEWEMECMTYLSAFQGLPCQSLWFSSLPYGLTGSIHVLLKFLLKHFAEMKSVQLIRALPLFTECRLCWAKLFKHLFSWIWTGKALSQAFLAGRSDEVRSYLFLVAFLCCWETVQWGGARTPHLLSLVEAWGGEWLTALLNAVCPYWEPHIREVLLAQWPNAISADV